METIPGGGMGLRRGGKLRLKSQVQRSLFSQAEDQHDRELSLLLLVLGLVCECDIPLVFFSRFFSSSGCPDKGS